MKEDKYFWDYKREPGKFLNKNYIKSIYKEPLVSIVTSYYNAYEFMWQTINCVLNQTFPYWEWIIVDDGSDDQKAIEYLKKVNDIDDRIKIYHQKNAGLAKGRDYAITKSTTDYILPLDTDDLIEPTYIETLYWALKTNPDASWAFTNSIGFGKYMYLVDHEFDSEKMKYENQITVTALIKKKQIINLGGYGLAKRYVNEDWHLWLRMLAQGYYPVQVTYYGFWYRRRKESLLSEINDKNKKENELRLRDLKKEADKIERNVKPILYPHEEYTDILEYTNIEWNGEKLEYTKKNILYIIPSIVIDKKIIKQIKEKSKDFNIYIIALENSKHSQYAFRQKLEEFSIVFNLTTFLDKKYYLSFIEYIVNTRNIKDIFLARNCKYKNDIINFFKAVVLFEYKESILLYYLEIFKYKLKHTIICRAMKKFIRLLK